jgi:uncharacterized LabA/DUF88 family protein
MMKKQVVYAFIDSQNLNLGIKKMGWRLDYRRFRLYLKNKYAVSEAYIFIGFDPSNQKLYTALQAAGFIIVFKPTVTYVDENGDIKIKGNVDAELVLHAAAKTIDQYDKAIVVSGDGDFYCLYEYLDSLNKLKQILVPNRSYSGLLSPIAKYIIRLDLFRQKLEYINKKSSTPAVGRNLRPGGGRSKRNGRSKP